LGRWKGFRIGSQPPKFAKGNEQEIYSALIAAAERAGLATIDAPARAHHLIQGISLMVMLQGRKVSVKHMIEDAIASAKLGRAAITRKFVFDIYQEQYDFGEHHVSVEGAGPANKQRDSDEGEFDFDAQKAHVLVTAADFTAYDLKCQECSAAFEFSPSNQAYYNKNKIERPPQRCERCNKAHKARMGTKQCHKFEKGKCDYGSKCRFKHGDAVLCVEANTVMCTEEPAQEGIELWDDASDYDSDEDKPWRK
jgi:hypothetical protein